MCVCMHLCTHVCVWVCAYVHVNHPAIIETIKPIFGYLTLRIRNGRFKSFLHARSEVKFPHFPRCTSVYHSQPYLVLQVLRLLLLVVAPVHTPHKVVEVVLEELLIFSLTH